MKGYTDGATVEESLTLIPLRASFLFPSLRVDKSKHAASKDVLEFFFCLDKHLNVTSTSRRAYLPLKIPDKREGPCSAASWRPVA